MLTEMGAGTVIVGGVLSKTVTLKLRCAAALAPSLTLQATGVVPSGKLDPEGGLHVGAPIGPPASVSVGAGLNVTTADVTPLTEIGAIEGTEIVGTVVSCTVTANCPLTVLPPPSFAVHITVVVPYG